MTCSKKDASRGQAGGERSVSFRDGDQSESAAAEMGFSMNASETSGKPPQAEPALRAIAMPADANPHGDIFGGWLLSQMDLAGGAVARRRAKGRTVTVAITGMTFHRPGFRR